ncbi:MAG: T9SS type A sorting domain-containing protein, partial [Dysgonamonadaceae bacterium]|nr:T9SS type A sorting domain-containing protein [Dysgonamonadaceae bacterium]
ATVYKTEDYGVAWTKQNIGDASYDTDFYSINIMENKTYLAMVYNQYSFLMLFSTEDQIEWNQTEHNWFQRREVPFFVNDNTGYIASSLWPVGAASYGVFAVLKTENGGTQWSDIEMRDHLYIEQEESLGKPEKITVVNDTLGYAIVGQVLCKTPAPASPPPDGIEKFENRNVLKISRTGQKELLIQSESKPVLSIEIFDIAGNKLAHNQWINPAKEITVQMDSYAAGVYVINATHCDNTLSINKYIKN